MSGEEVNGTVEFPPYDEIPTEQPPHPNTIPPIPESASIGAQKRKRAEFESANGKAAQSESVDTESAQSQPPPTKRARINPSPNKGDSNAQSVPSTVSMEQSSSIDTTEQPTNEVSITDENETKSEKKDSNESTANDKPTMASHPGYAGQSNISRHRTRHKSQRKKPQPSPLNSQRNHGKIDRNKNVGVASQPTLQQMETDPLFTLSRKIWNANTQQTPTQDTKPKPKKFNRNLVQKIYNEEILPSVQNVSTNASYRSQRLIILEFTRYLENYLWIHFDVKKSSTEHVLSMVYIINEKFRQQVSAWDCFDSDPKKFEQFFRRVFDLKLKELDVFIAQQHSDMDDTSDNKKKRKVLSMRERQSYILFLINCFYRMENDTVRRLMTSLIGLPIWDSLHPIARKRIFQMVPDLEQRWAKYEKLREKFPLYRSQLMPKLLEEFYAVLDEMDSIVPKLDSTDTDRRKEMNDKRWYLCRFLELIIDTLCMLLTRRYLRPLLIQTHFLLRCELSAFGKWSQQQQSSQDRLFHQLTEKVKFYLRFEIDDFDGRPLSDDEMRIDNYTNFMALQKCAYKYFYQDAQSMALSNISALDNRSKLSEYLSVLNVAQLKKIVSKLHILPNTTNATMESLIKKYDEKELLTEIIIRYHLSRESQRNNVNNLPLYPTETVLWDRNIVPTERYDSDSVLSLPKLNLQFLTIYDYLLRNFDLFRLESAYSIREDIAKAVWKIRPRLKRNPNTRLRSTVFTGYSRMGIPIDGFSITNVGRPRLGESKPAKVTSEIEVDLRPFAGDTRDEWESLREHDVLFLIRVRSKRDIEDTSIPDQKIQKWGVGGKTWESLTCDELGIEFVRGCEVICVKDQTDSIIGERNWETGEVYQAKGTKRIYEVALDTAQYQSDMTEMAERDGPDVYSHFNLLMRRRAKENNFKAVLETIRSLMNSQCALPDWFENVFLGFGDPSSAAYFNIGKDLEKMREDYVKSDYYCMDFRDTFIDTQHLQHSFPGKYIMIVDDNLHTTEELNDNTATVYPPPYRIWFHKDDPRPRHELLLKGAFEYIAPSDDSDSGYPVLVQPYSVVNEDIVATPHVKRNTIKFTPIQLEAIKSGMHSGLTMVVGPPGTGKTDVAVQIISNLYHNFPNQRTLLVTHSNQALNDLFEKIMIRDIDERYLLRLGYGAKELESASSFTKMGRVSYMLNMRINRLKIASSLAESMGQRGDRCATCETSLHFYESELLTQWESFEDSLDEIEHNYADKLSNSDNAIVLPNGGDEPIPVSNLVARFFPFTTFAETIVNPAFNQVSYSEDKAAAYRFWRYIQQLFDDIKQCHVFELLRTHKDRSQYLLTRQAKIIAMTCTHAAMKRSEFLKLKLQYDNIIMEEAAQVLDIETFIPLVLQEADKEAGCRLKRVILIGDHFQLPPVVKNMAFQKYSKLDQSLFTRLVRLGTPTFTLNMQGRSRPSIAALYSWRYPQLGNLPNVIDYKSANGGFLHEYQIVNVDDYMGRGEYQPTPYFYQNLGEAEYIAQVFMYMRLLGYSADRISVLTTYNGQKHLLREVFCRRCENDPLYGMPHKIDTVDKYQGQQNDFVLLSLVRTNAVGHIRDIRRLVVALSRARYGLYIFGRVPLFSNCFELSQSFQQLLQRSQQLQLVTNESHPTSRQMDASVSQSSEDDKSGDNTSAVVHFSVSDVRHMSQVVKYMSQSVRSYHMTAYQTQLSDFNRKARSALEDKRKRDNEEREAAEAEAAAEAERKAQSEAETAKMKRTKSNRNKTKGMKCDKMEVDSSDNESEKEETITQTEAVAMAMAVDDKAQPPAMVGVGTGEDDDDAEADNEDNSDNGGESDSESGDENDNREETSDEQSKLVAANALGNIDESVIVAQKGLNEENSADMQSSDDETSSSSSSDDN